MKLTIKDGRDHFYTFDTNRILLLTATDEDMIKQVEFSTEENGEEVSWTSEVLTGSDGVKYVQVPNEFLNGDYTRLVCYYVALDSNGEYTRQKEIFRIRARQEPQDYYLTYSERVTFASIKALTEQYKSNASDSAELASKYAENNEDVAVESGKYSAKHWSIKSNKKYEEIRSYVGSASDPESALGSIESARANAVSDVEKQETDSIEAVGTYTSNTAIPSVSQYVEGTAKPSLKTYGEQQVDSYVNGTSKLELDRYVNNDKKQVLDEYTSEKKSELDNYTETDKKQVLDSYTENEKKAELDAHAAELKEQLNAHTVEKAGDLNEYTTGLKSELDGYTTAKEQDISEFTEQKKSEVQGVYQADFNELKGDLSELDNGLNNINNNYAELVAEKNALKVEVARNRRQIENLNNRLDGDLIENKYKKTGETPDDAGVLSLPSSKLLPFAEVDEVHGMTEAYSENLLHSARIAKVESVGRNLFDEKVVETGYLVDGQIKTDYGTRWASESYIKVEPSTQYYIGITYQITDYGIRISWYDANKTHISTSDYYTSTITSPEGAEYMRFNTDSSYGSQSYNGDCVVQLASITDRTYIPHSHGVVNLPSLELKKGDVYYPSTGMKQETWHHITRKSDITGEWYINKGIINSPFVSSEASGGRGIKRPANNGVVPRIIIAGYETVTVDNISKKVRDKICSVSVYGRIMIYDASITSSIPDFDIIYMMSTPPEPTKVADPIDNGLAIESNGTISVFSDGATAEALIHYAIDNRSTT